MVDVKCWRREVLAHCFDEDGYHGSLAPCMVPGMEQALSNLLKG